MTNEDVEFAGIMAEVRKAVDAASKRRRLSDDAQLRAWRYLQRSVAQEFGVRASRVARRHSWAHVGDVLSMSRQGAYKSLMVPLDVDGKVPLAARGSTKRS